MKFKNITSYNHIRIQAGTVFCAIGIGMLAYPASGFAQEDETDDVSVTAKKKPVVKQKK